MQQTLKSALAAAALALPLLAATAPDATAQGSDTNNCNGNVFVNSIYTNGTGQNAFEYFIQVQNRSNSMRTFQLNFSGMPNDVRVEQNPLRGSILRPFEQATLRFGTGTTTNDLTLGRMAVTMDALTLAGRPAVRVSGCTRAAF